MSQETGQYHLHTSPDASKYFQIHSQHHPPQTSYIKKGELPVKTEEAFLPGKLSPDLHPSLLSSKANSPGSPQPSSPLIRLSQPPTAAGNPREASSQVCQRSGPAKQVGELRVFTLPPLLQILSPPVSCSALQETTHDGLPWLSAPLPRGTQLILVRHPTFSLCKHPLSPKAASIPKCQFPIPRNIFYLEPIVATPSGIPA